MIRQTITSQLYIPLSTMQRLGRRHQGRPFTRRLYREIPHLDGTIVRAGHDLGAGKLHTRHAAGVPAQRQHAAPGLQVPHLESLRVRPPATPASLALVWTSGGGRRRPAAPSSGAHLNGLVVAAADHEPRVKLQVAHNAPVPLCVRPVQRGQALARVDIPELPMSVDRTRCEGKR